MNKNAIILAAGKSNRFAPFTYEKPKGLFRVKGELLIERQIEQLIESGIEEIIVVIGYMKEKFFYLEHKYKQVKLIVNNTYDKFGNVYSLYLARKYISKSFICCADQYFVINPFIKLNNIEISYRLGSVLKGNFREFAVNVSNENIITDCKIGGRNEKAMIGYAYFNESFSKKFIKLLEKEIDNFGIANMFWEEFYAKHISELTLKYQEISEKMVLEFDNIDELRRFDSDFLLNVDSEIVSNICGKLQCNPNEIHDISVIQAGLTNVSFKFSVNKESFVYRHPGGTSGKLIDRKTELFTQKKASELGLDNSFIYMDPTGWKLSYLVTDIVKGDFLNNSSQFKKAIKYIKSIHKVDILDNKEIKVFDNFIEGIKLIKIASATKGNLLKEFEELIKKVEIVNKFVLEEREKNNIKLVLSHNDVYEPNFLINKKNEFYMIDWEYAGLNDPANDICCVITRSDYTKEDSKRILNEYYDNQMTEKQYVHAIGQSILTAFYWFCWGLYKGSVGDDDGFFFLSTYRYLIREIDETIKMYKEFN